MKPSAGKLPLLVALAVLVILAGVLYLSGGSTQPVPSPPLNSPTHSTAPTSTLGASSSSTQPKITWSENNIEVILSPGEGTSRDLTFTSSLPLQNIVIEAVPEIAGFLSVQPNTFASVPANQPQSVRLNFSIPSAAALGTFDGTIHVRVGTQTLPATLKVRIHVWQLVVNQRLGVELKIPPAMTASQETDALGDSLYIHEVDEEFPNGISIRKHNRDIALVVSDFTGSLRIVSQDQLVFGDRTWSVYVLSRDRDGLLFIDAFTRVNESTYQVGGLANNTLVQTLPKLLSTFNFF